MKKGTYFKYCAEKGISVYSGVNFNAGDLILVNNIIKIPELPKDHALWAYGFWWKDPNDLNSSGQEVLAEGVIGLLNHSKNPNCKVVNNFIYDRLELYAEKNIKPNEELTHDYGCDLWF